MDHIVELIDSYDVDSDDLSDVVDALIEAHKEKKKWSHKKKAIAGLAIGSAVLAGTLAYKKKNRVKVPKWEEGASPDIADYFNKKKWRGPSTVIQPKRVLPKRISMR